MHAETKQAQGKCASKIQALAQKIPVICPRSKQLSEFNTQMMHDAFLPNSQLTSERTSNCTINENQKFYYVRIMMMDRLVIDIENDK